MSSTQAQIIHYCQRMDQKGWVANHDGNISIKVAPDRFLVTPTGRSKADLSTADLLEIDPSGGKKVFSEWAIHAKVFEQRPEVGAVVHAHPPYATAVGCANQEMTTGALPEAVVSLGPGVPLVGLCLPGSPEFWSEFEPLLPHYDAVMVGGNGVFTWGKTLELAFLRMELVEHLAEILLHTLPLGGPKLLSLEQTAELLKKREKAGLALPVDPQRSSWFVK